MRRGGDPIVSLVMLTGAVRSGKSAAAEALAASRGKPVVVAVGGREDDAEMTRRIEAHKAARPHAWTVREVGTDPGWLADVPAHAVLIVECLSTLVGLIAWEEAGEAEFATAVQENRAETRTDALVSALRARGGDTIVVSNEAGWGVVPATAAGRLFRDVLGRANRTLVDAADAAYLVVSGRFIDLKAAGDAPAWPADEPERDDR
jgi:adenosylcobinamide kinase / adenosylcobinamide-phosphate guanylyltransferase